MRFVQTASIGVMVAASFLTAGCARKQDPDELRRETAQATSVAKQDAKAVVEGVREGLKSDKTVDLNDASKTELLALPGLSASQADKIIASRPFGSSGE